MTISCNLYGVIPDPKPPDDAFFAEFDVSSWLGEDTISTVAFSAKDTAGTVVTSTVLDATKNTNTTTIIKPYIKAGTSGTDYIIAMKVTTAEGDIGTFYIKFSCRDLSTT